MTSGHRDETRTVYPETAEKLFLLRSFADTERSGDIVDPIGMSLEIYREIRDEISTCLPGLVAFLRALK
jgi:protein-tyrosine-phosphatase